MTSLSLLSRRAIAPLDSRRYVIEKRSQGGIWQGIAYATSTREADTLMTRLVRYSGGRYRAIEQKAPSRFAS